MIDQEALVPLVLLHADEMQQRLKGLALGEAVVSCVTPLLSCQLPAAP